MNNEGLKYWKAIPGLAAGSFVGLFMLLTLRSEYYDVMKYQKNMHPGIAFSFLPVLFIIVLIVALPLERLFRSLHVPSSHFQAGIIGIGYATLFVWWAFPAHWRLFLLINPLSVRILLGFSMQRLARQSFKRTGMVLLFLTMPVTGFGTHVQSHSPNFQAYQQHRIDSIAVENPGKDLSPGFGLGLAMASSWPFTVAMQGVLILLFIASSSFVRLATRRSEHNIFSWASFIVYTGFWAFGIFMLFGSAVENIRWNFILLAIAQIITSLGLMIGSAGLFQEISSENARADR